MINKLVLSRFRRGIYHELNMYRSAFIWKNETHIKPLRYMTVNVHLLLKNTECVQTHQTPEDIMAEAYADPRRSNASPDANNPALKK